MSKKIDEAFFQLRAEAEHHLRLAIARDDNYENGFAQGLSEALRIVSTIRETQE